MPLINWQSFKTQYFLVFSAFNLLRYVGLVDRAVTVVGGSIIMTTLAWNATKYLRTYFNREYLSSFKKAVVITGADKGLAHDFAVKLNEHGFRVYATVFNIDGPAVETLVNSSRFENLMSVIKMDVRKEEEVNKVALDIKTELEANGEQLWAVINAAEVQEFGHFDWSEFALYEKIFDVNTFGTVRVVRAFLPLLRQSKGRIVNIESIAGRIAIPKLTAYCMSKHANLAFADALRREMFDWGINVTTVEMAFNRKPAHSSNDKFTRSINKQWNKTLDEVKNYYGSEYLEQIKIEKLTTIFQNDLDKTMDDLIDSVRGQDPAIRYTPYTTCKARLLSNFVQVLPMEWLDKYYFSTDKDEIKPSIAETLKPKTN